MSDPVDTDALRAWAVDAREIAAAGGSGPNLLTICADKLSAAADEVDKLWDNLHDRENEADRLRALIEKARHAVECKRGGSGNLRVPCTCWKADAL